MTALTASVGLGYAINCPTLLPGLVSLKRQGQLRWEGGVNDASAPDMHDSEANRLTCSLAFQLIRRSLVQRSVRGSAD